MSVLLLIVLFALLFLLFVSLILLVVGPSMLLQPYRRTVDWYRRHTNVFHPAHLGMRHEERTLKTAEGIPLSSWLLRPPCEPVGTVILLHGVSESKIAPLPLAKYLYDHCFNVFLYDSRRHGDSGGTYCTYGFYEKHDVSTAITYLQSRTDLQTGKIGLFGSSMGAAVALQAASLDKRVAAVVAESGFARLRTTFDDYQKKMIKLPFHYLRNLVIKRSEHLAHFRANAVAPVDAVRDISVPLLLIHGTADRSIRHEYSLEVFRNAREPKELWLIKGATHSDVPEIGGEEYLRRIEGFFRRHLA